MVTARRVGRWALYGVGGLLGLVVLARVGLGIYLATPAGKAMVARKLEQQIGMPVQVTSVRVGFVTSSIGMRVLDPAVPAPADTAVLDVDSAEADVSMFGLAAGDVDPGWVELRGVNLTLHVAANGKITTTLPKTKSTGGGGGPLPSIKLTGGQITIQQEGRPDFALHNLDLAVESQDGKVRLSGSVDDPVWSKWSIAGEVDRAAKTGWLQLDTPDGPLTMDPLASLPFIPPEVWESVRPDGRGAVSLRAWTGSAGKTEYSAEIRPKAASLTVPAASVTITHLTGLIRLTGDRVELRDTRAELAGGTITADGEYDYAPEPNVVNLKVSAEGLDIRHLPPEWRLPKDFEGKLKGHADLAVKIYPDGHFVPEGGGEGVITDVKVLGFPGDDIPIHLRRQGNRYEFHQPKEPKSQTLRPAPRERVEFAAAVPVFTPEGWDNRARGNAPGAAILAVGVRRQPPSPLAGEGSREGRAFSAGEGSDVGTDQTAPSPGSLALLAHHPLPQGERAFRGRSHAGGYSPPRPLMEAQTATLLTLLQPAAQPKKDAEQEPNDPREGDSPTLDATVRLRDIDIAQLLERLQIKLGYKISGKVTAEVAISAPIGGALSTSAYGFSGKITSAALTLEGLTLRDLSAKMTYRNGKLTLDDLSGKIDQPAKDGAPGTFKGSASAQVSPPGPASASFRFDRIPLGELLRGVPNLTIEARGTLSGEAAVSAPYERLWDPEVWNGSGKLTSPELVVEGRAVKHVHFSAEVAKGVFAMKEARLNLEGIPVSGEATVGLTGEYAFAAAVRTTGTDITDLRKLVPEVEIPAPVEGVLETETKVTGTASPLAFTATGTVRALKLTLGRSTANHVAMQWKLTRDRLTVSDLKAELFGGTVTGSADVPFDKDEAGKFEVAFKELDAAAATELVPDFPVRIAGRVSGKVGGEIPPAKPGQPRVGNLDLNLTAPKLAVQGVPAERLVGRAALKGNAVEYQLEGKTLGGSFEIKGRYPGRKKQEKAAPAQKGDRGSFRLTGIDLSRVAPEAGFRSLAPLRGRLDAAFDFENDLSAGSGRVTLTDLKWGDTTIARELAGLLVLEDGVLTIPEVTGRVAGGELRARGRVLLRDTTRNFFSLSLNGADSKRLLAPFTGSPDLLDGPLTLVVRGRVGRETRLSGLLAVPRGTASGVQVSDLRVPFEVAMSPGGYGRLAIREAAGRAGTGRARAELTADWGYSTRLDGRILFSDVPLRTISPAIGESGLFGNGRITGRFDIGGQNVRSADDLTGTLVATLNNTSVREIPVLQETVRFLNPSGLVKPFQSGDLRATLRNGVFNVQRLALANPAAQLFAAGTVSTSGRVDLDVVAHTGVIGPDVPGLRLFGLRLPVFGPIPITLIRDVTDFLSNRTIRMTITGTTSNPIVRVNVGALLREEAVRFFLTRYLPMDTAAALGFGAGFGSTSNQK